MFNMSAVLNALLVMLMGMAGIFIVTLIIVICVVLLKKAVAQTRIKIRTARQSNNKALPFRKRVAAPFFHRKRGAAVLDAGF